MLPPYGRAMARGWVAAAGTFVVLGAWPLAVALFGSLHPATPIFQSSISPDLLSSIAPSPLITVDPLWVRTLDAAWYPDAVDQSSAYVGVVLVGFTAAAVLALRRRLAVVVAAASGAVMAVLSLGPNLRVAGHVTGVPLPWIVFSHLPLARFAVTGRLVAFVWLAIAVIVAEAVRAVTRSELRAGLIWIVVLGAGLALVVPSLSFASTVLPTPPIFTDARLVHALPNGGVVYVAPFPRGDTANIAPMQWQAEARMRFSMPGGYVLVPDRSGALQSASAPVDALSRALITLQTGGAAPPRTSWPGLRADLGSVHATAVLVGPMDHEHAVAVFMAALLGAPPRAIGGVYLWRLERRF